MPPADMIKPKVIHRIRMRNRKFDKTNTIHEEKVMQTYVSLQLFKVAQLLLSVIEFLFDTQHKQYLNSREFDLLQHE